MKNFVFSSFFALNKFNKLKRNLNKKILRNKDKKIKTHFRKRNFYIKK